MTAKHGARLDTKYYIPEKNLRSFKMSFGNPVKKGNKKDAYKNLPNHVKQFQHLDSLPMIVKFGCDETAENWEFHRASWHTSCYAKFSSCKTENKTQQWFDRNKVSWWAKTVEQWRVFFCVRRELNKIMEISARRYIWNRRKYKNNNIA